MSYLHLQLNSQKQFSIDNFIDNLYIHLIVQLDTL